MSKELEIAAVERNLKEAKAIKELGVSLSRLEKNRDFLAVVEGAYFRDEAVRLVHLRGDPAMQTPERQASIVKQIDAISGFSQFLVLIGKSAEMAEKSIANDEAVLEEFRTEGAN